MTQTGNHQYFFENLVPRLMNIDEIAGNPNAMKKLATGTADWYREQGQLDKAIKYAAKAGNADLEADLKVEKLKAFGRIRL